MRKENYSELLERPSETCFVGDEGKNTVNNNDHDNHENDNNHDNDNDTLKSFVNFNILMIRRRFTLGYSEFIRGKYELTEKSVLHLFNQMIPEEIEAIRTNDFDTLWVNLWNNEKNNEYAQSKIKFEKVKENNNCDYNIDNIMKMIVLSFTEPEWGFPKGRRDKSESTLHCAIREFCEETNLKKDNIDVLHNIEPLAENFVGTNGVNYRHIYYLAILHSNVEVGTNLITSSNFREIGNIGLYDYNTSLSKIRTYHQERKQILHNINHFVNHQANDSLS